MKYIHIHEINFTKKALLMKRLNSIDILLKKYTNTAEILENYDEIAYFLHDDVEHILWKERKPLSWVAFSHSIDITRQQLLFKQHLDGIKEFLGLDAEGALRWLVSRLKNNSINFYKEKPHEAVVYYDESLNYDLMDIEKTKANNPTDFTNAFARLARDALLCEDFDWQDFLYLCRKYEIDSEQFVLSPVTSSAEQSAAGFLQLVFGFDGDGQQRTIRTKVKRFYGKRKRKRKEGGLFL